MENQYCKVGSTNSVGSGRESIDWLERQYHHFLEKAAEAQQGESKLREFFERKALQLQEQLQNLMHA